MTIRHFHIAMFAALCLPIFAQAQTPDPHQVPIMDGGAGPCSVAYTVTDNGTPVYDARIKVHIEYGFGGFHRLDLEAATNVDGKTKFVGLPKKVKGGTLYFNATKGDKTGSATYDPDKGCDGENDSIALANH